MKTLIFIRKKKKPLFVIGHMAPEQNFIINCTIQLLIYF